MAYGSLHDKYNRSHDLANDLSPTMKEERIWPTHKHETHEHVANLPDAHLDRIFRPLSVELLGNSSHVSMFPCEDDNSTPVPSCGRSSSQTNVIIVQKVEWFRFRCGYETNGLVDWHQFACKGCLRDSQCLGRNENRVSRENISA